MLSEERIMAIIKRVCGVDITLNTEILAEGRLDSYSLIYILSELEDEGISIEPTSVDIKRFSTPKDIIDLVREKSGSV